MNDYIKRNKIPIVSAVFSLISSFFIIDFSSIQEFDVWLFVAIIFVYSITFVFFYILITSFIDGIKNDMIEEEKKLINGAKK